MIKLLLLAFLIFSYAHAEGESSSSEEDLKSVATFFQTKLNSTLITDVMELSEKTKKQCPDIEDKLETTIEDVGKCIEEIDLGEDTFCTILRNNFEKCAEPVKKMLVGCLPEESKGLPVMGIKIVKAVLDQACNSTVEEILELFNPCAMEKELESYDTCVKVKNALTEYKNKVPSKAFVCTLLPNIKSCVKSHREATCKNPVTKQSMVHFYEAVDDATASECADLNRTK